MKLKDRIYISLTKFLPRSYVKYFEKLMQYAGEEQNAMIYLGSSFLLSVLIAAILISYGYFYTELSYLLISAMAVASFLGIQLLFYLLVYFKMEKRVDLVEQSLPDQLQLMANNVKSGMTPFHALKLSARDEFGPLSVEIRSATNKGLGMNSFTESLVNIVKRIRSTTLERVLKLEASSLKTGAHLSSLLTELATDIRETQSLRKDLVSKTKTYTAFILFTVLVGTPVLLSISIHFVNMISGFSNITPMDSSASAGFDIGFFGGGVGISPDFLLNLSYFMLAATTFLASMLLGVIIKGKATSGIKYAPVLIIVVLVIFTVVRIGVSSFFGTMI